jgi:hypothetical protein
VVWDGSSTRTANDLVRPRVDEDEAPALAEAMRVLKEILADGPMAAGNVKRQAATAGVAERTLDRARQALGVTTRRQGFGQGAFDVWAMPADPLEAMAQGTHGRMPWMPHARTSSRAARICSSTTPTTPGGSRDDRSCCPVRRLRQLVPGRGGDRLR